MQRSRLALECAKADVAEEQAMAEEGIAEDLARWISPEQMDQLVDGLNEIIDD
ncbi:hypothetical protein ABFB09_01930 [Dehalogenimonas sp. THU2]|uniref:hypothetical protein n=1 Tax=Dehalogenimonas sp. THU2 TaxID=3151121 RepID=UPI003218619B